MKTARFSIHTYKLLFALLLAICYQAGQVWHALPLQPQSLHISAQCDRASIAQNFYEDDMNIFLPRINNRMRGTGIAAAEFPLVNFLAACCYKIFGFHDFWYRFVSLLFFTLGLLLTYRLARLLLRNEIATILVSLLWLSSPTLLFYIPNYNPDPAALGLIMIAWYYFFSWQREARRSKLLWLGLAAALAMLMKASTAVSIVAMAGLIFLDIPGWLGEKRKKIIPQKALLLLVLFLAAAITWCWYDYAKGLNAKYFSGFFTLFTRTPESIEQVLDIWQELKAEMLLRYYAPWMLCIIILLQLTTVILYRHIPRQLFLLCWMLCAGSLAFIFIMFVAFRNHDYYVIALLPWIFFLLLSAAMALQSLLPAGRLRLAGFGASMLLICNLIYCHHKNSALYNNDILLYHDIEFKAYYDVEPLIRELGITRDDLFLSMTDVTYDVSLYLVDQKGFTIPDKKDINRIFYYLCVEKAAYLLTNSDECLPDLPVVKEFLGEPILIHKNLKLYKPSDDKQLRNRIHHVLHQHLHMQRKQLLDDPNWVRYNTEYSKTCGVSVDAALDESSLYVYQLDENKLNEQLKAFAKEKYGSADSIRTAREAFRKKPEHGEKELYILDHPYAHWFDHF